MSLRPWILDAIAHRLRIRLGRLSGPDGRVTCTLCAERFHLEVARRPDTLALGLAGRPRLAPNQGLLLMLPAHRAPGAISTRSMRFALDLVFLDPAGQVIRVALDAKPGLFPGVPVPAGAVTVLELVSGTAPRLGLAAGTQLPALARARLTRKNHH